MSLPPSLQFQFYSFMRLLRFVLEKSHCYNHWSSDRNSEFFKLDFIYWNTHGLLFGTVKNNPMQEWRFFVFISEKHFLWLICHCTLFLYFIIYLISRNVYCENYCCIKHWTSFLSKLELKLHIKMLTQELHKPAKQNTFAEREWNYICFSYHKCNVLNISS